MHLFQFPERDHTNRAMGKADSDCVALEQRPLGLLESLSVLRELTNSLILFGKAIYQLHE